MACGFLSSRAVTSPLRAFSCLGVFEHSRQLLRPLQRPEWRVALSFRRGVTEHVRPWFPILMHLQCLLHQPLLRPCPSGGTSVAVIPSVTTGGHVDEGCCGFRGPRHLVKRQRGAEAQLGLTVAVGGTCLLSGQAVSGSIPTWLIWVSCLFWFSPTSPASLVGGKTQAPGAWQSGAE